jgi:hypothetical protein
MKRYEPGDKGRAVCESCESVVSTTFAVRDVPFSDGVGTAKDILVAVCDLCDDVVAIPAQSVASIAEVRKQVESK